MTLEFLKWARAEAVQQARELPDRPENIGVAIDIAREIMAIDVLTRELEEKP